MKKFLEPWPGLDLYRGTKNKWLGDEIGRLARLKILWGQPRAGSIPARATICQASRTITVDEFGQLTFGNLFISVFEFKTL